MKDSSRNSLLLVILLVVSVITLSGSLGFYYLEKSSHENLTLWDSFWWTMVTVTTIGYGDIFPKTVGGRLIAIVLMFVGIGTLGVLTAAIAAYFVKTDQLQMLRLRRLQNHVVICGLGDSVLVVAFAALSTSNLARVPTNEVSWDSIVMRAAASQSF